MTGTGVPCQAFALENTLCYMHDPGRATERTEARARGGHVSSKLRLLRGKQARLDTPAQLITFVAGVVHSVVTGEMMPDTARAALYGVSIARQLIESSDMENRLRALEEHSDRPNRHQRRS